MFLMLFRAMENSIYEEVSAKAHPGAFVCECDDRQVPMHLLRRTALLNYCYVVNRTDDCIFRTPSGFMRSWIRCALAVECYMLKGTHLSHLLRDEELDKLIVVRSTLQNYKLVQVGPDQVVSLRYCWNPWQVDGIA